MVYCCSFLHLRTFVFLRRSPVLSALSWLPSAYKSNTWFATLTNTKTLKTWNCERAQWESEENSGHDFISSFLLLNVVRDRLFKATWSHTEPVLILFIFCVVSFLFPILGGMVQFTVLQCGRWLHINILLSVTCKCYIFVLCYFFPLPFFGAAVECFMYF